MIESVIVRSPAPWLLIAPPLPSPVCWALGPDALLLVKTELAMLNRVEKAALILRRDRAGNTRGDLA